MVNSFSIFKSKRLFTVVCVILFIGLFILGTELVDTRLDNELWNLLHLVAFFIVWLFLTSLFSAFQPDSLQRIGVIILVTLLASAAIEIIQHYIGRSASLKDIGLNLTGTLLALIFVIYKQKHFPGSSHFIYICFLLIAGILLWPSTKIFIDEVYITRQFPVLSDFSTPFETSRWQTRTAEAKIVEEDKSKVLDVVLLPESKYPSITLESFGQTWEKYTELVIELNNTMNSNLPLTLRLHDKAHNNNYADRFNKSINFSPGTTELVVPILDLYNAPRNRKMDINRIKSIMLFAIDIDQKKHFRIKKVFLR